MEAIEKILYYFKKLKYYILFVSFLFCLAINYLPIDNKEKYIVPFVFAAALIIIEILVRLSIHIDKSSESALTGPATKNEAFRRVEREIESQIRKKSGPDNILIVKILGFRGQHLSSWLETLLSQNKRNSWFKNIQFDVYLVDIDYAKNLEGMQHRITRIKSSVDALRSLISDLKTDENLIRRHIEIRVFTYKTTNPFQVFLIGDDYLALSYFMPKFESGKIVDWISPVENPYYFYRRDSMNQQFMFKLVESWLDYYSRGAPYAESKTDVLS